MTSTFTSTSNHSPDPATWIKNRQLQAGTGLGVKIGNVGLLGIGVPAERRRIIYLAPIRPADKVRGRVELGGEIQYVDRLVRHHQRIDLQVREVQLDVQLVQRPDELGDDTVRFKKEDKRN